jgi:rubrerythrin
MKRNLFFMAIAITVMAFMASCGGNKQENKDKPAQDTTVKVNKTAENLKAALKGEATASAKYDAFAKKAKEEGQLQISKLFEATSNAEGVHVANHKKVLEEMGEKADIQPDTFSVKTTKENLEAALKGETYEVQTMYPGFVTQAQTDNADKAVKSFNWALDTEKKHIKMYQAALDAFNAKKTKSLSSQYYVCPKCGFTYDAKDIQAECELCGTEKAKYTVFK